MRVLILLLCALVVGLAVPVIIYAGGGRAATVGARFTPGTLLYDAQPGEEATYRDQEGNTLIWTVERRLRPEERGQDRLLIRVRMKDRNGDIMSVQGGDVTYEHDFANHKYYPLMAPLDPEGLDRRWIWTRIRQESHALRGKDTPCWRVDFVDPALPAEREEVQAWFHSGVAVFGLVEFQRAGRRWTLVASRFAP